MSDFMKIIHTMVWAGFALAVVMGTVWSLCVGTAIGVVAALLLP